MNVHATKPARPAFLPLVNGDKAPQTFSSAEMARRLAAARGAMAEAGADWAVLTSIHNIAWLSGFLYTAFGRPYALVVGPDRMVTVAANIDAGQPWRRSAGEALTYTDWTRDAFERAVASLIPAGATVGIEADHLTLALGDRLSAALTESTLTDVGAGLMHRRLVKSDEEIALIRSGAAVADIGGAACRDAIRPGAAEWEVAEAGVAAMTRAIAERHPETEIRDTWVWFQSGLNTDGAHNPLTTRRLGVGDPLSLNTFPMIAGYYTALERTMFLGEPDPASLRNWEANMAVHRAGLALIRPGAACSDICRALNAVYREHGLLDRRTFGYGHSFGVLSHYYGREAGLELREDCDTVLVPGMVVSMEPMIMIPEGEAGAGGYREHDILVVTEDGADNITGFPAGPDHNIIAA